MPEPRSKLPAYALLGFALAWPTMTTWLYFIALADQPAVWQQGMYSVGKVIQFALPLLWWCWLRRPVVNSARNVSSSLLIGGGFGLAVLLAMLVAYHFWLAPAGFFTASQGIVQAKVAGLGIGSPLAFISLAIFYSLVHSFLEEYYWRWFVFRECQAHLNLPLAIVISSLGFMAHHVLVLATYFGWSAPTTYLLSVSVAIGGAFWAWLYQKYGTLLGPWISHLLIDAAIFIIGYQLAMGGT